MGGVEWGEGWVGVEGAVGWVGMYGGWARLGSGLGGGREARKVVWWVVVGWVVWGVRNTIRQGGVGRVRKVGG